MTIKLGIETQPQGDFLIPKFVSKDAYVVIDRKKLEITLDCHRCSGYLEKKLVKIYKSLIVEKIEKTLKKLLLSQVPKSLNILLLKKYPVTKPLMEDEGASI